MIRQEIRQIKKERILQEARALFHRHGFRGTTLDMVAAAMGVTKPFIYGIYERKVDILFDIAIRNIGSSLEAIEGAIAMPGTPTQRLAELARRLARVCIDHRDAVAVFFRDENSLEPDQRAQIHALQQRFDDALARLLQAGIDAGELKPIDPRTATLAIGGMIGWMFVWYRPEGRLSPEDLMEHMAQYALRIAGARSSA